MHTASELTESFYILNGFLIFFLQSLIKQ